MMYNSFPFRYTEFTDPSDIASGFHHYIAYIDLEFDVKEDNEVEIIDAQVSGVCHCSPTGEIDDYVSCPDFFVLHKFQYDRQHFSDIDNQLRKAARSWRM